MAQKQAPHPRRKGSVVWATVLSWLSSLLLALLALCLVLMTSICSASYIKQQVNRRDFNEAAYSYLYDNFISYGASSGITYCGQSGSYPAVGCPYCQLTVSSKTVCRGRRKLFFARI